jgi:hypothetical protein
MAAPEVPARAAVDWQLPDGCAVAVDLAAGTGLFTRALKGRAQQAIAVSPLLVGVWRPSGGRRPIGHQERDGLRRCRAAPDPRSGPQARQVTDAAEQPIGAVAYRANADRAANQIGYLRGWFLRVDYVL